MLDKVLKVNDGHAVIYFTHRTPVNLYSSSGKVDELIDIMLCPLDSRCTTLSEHLERVRIGQEDTLIIHLDQLKEDVA